MNNNNQEEIKPYREVIVEQNIPNTVSSENNNNIGRKSPLNNNQEQYAKL